MKKIYVQKQVFLALNMLSLLSVAIGLYGGIMIEKNYYYLLIMAGVISLVSLLALMNKIYYDASVVKFSLMFKKETVKHGDIKEIFIQRSFLYGTLVVFNLESKLNGECFDCLEYITNCRKANIKNIVYIMGIPKKDLAGLLQYCRCDIKGEKL